MAAVTADGEVVGGTPDVDDPRAARGRGPREPRIIGEPRVQPVHDVDPGAERFLEDRIPLRRDGAAGDRDTDDELIGADRARLAERGHDRDALALTDAVEGVATGSRRVNDAHDVATPVAEEADGRLRVLSREVCLGEDGDAAHATSAPSRSTRPCSREATSPRSSWTPPFTTTRSMPSG